MIRSENTLNHQKTLLPVYAGLFLFSGAAGLVYQVVWERLLGTFFGVTTLSITIIVAAYMFGLGLGSMGGGVVSRRASSPLVIYAIIEVLVGLFGLASPFLFVWVGGLTAGAPYPVVFILSFGLLVIPTSLMGATLPLLSQGFIRQTETSGKVIGVLYGINTLGAALGALVSGFGLIGWLGLDGTTWTAVGANLLVGAIALIMARRGGGTKGEHEVEPEARSGNPVPAFGIRWILVFAFLTGFIGLGYEILWIRILSIVNKHTVYIFPSVLFVLLLGLAAGGWLFGRMADRSRNRPLLFCEIVMGVGLLAGLCVLIFLLGINGLPGIRDGFAARFYNPQVPASPFVWVGEQLVFSEKRMLAELGFYFLPVLLLILPAGLLMGGGLPLLDRIAIETPQIAGKRIGEIHLANIAGSVMGTLVVSFYFLPQWGSEATLKVLMGATLIFLAAAILPAVRTQNAVPVLRPVAIGGCILGLMVFLPAQGDLYRNLFAIGTHSDPWVTESRDGVLALTNFSPVWDNPTRLWIGSELNSAFPSDGTYESIAIPCASATRLPEDLLVIGLGGGNTAAFLSHLPWAHSITIVEIQDRLAPFLAGRFEPVAGFLKDPRFHYVLDDARRFLYRYPYARYDLIIMDPVRSITAGANNLYSREAMQLYKAHLKPGGIACIWRDEAHVIPNTSAQVFPYVDDHSNFMIASNDPIEYSIERIKELSRLAAETPYIDASLIDPTAILGGFKRNQDVIRSEEANEPILTDLRPYLEYYFFRRPPPR